MDMLRTMKIIYICNEYPPLPHGGIGTFVYTIAHGMVSKGHHVTVVGWGSSSKERDDCGVRVVILPMFTTRHIAWFVNRFRLYRWLKKEVHNGNVDIIETPEFGGLMPFKFNSCPIVVRLHLSNTAIDLQAGRKINKMVRFCEKQTLKNHRFWISVSKYSLVLTKEIFFLTPLFFKVIYYPINLRNINNIHLKFDLPEKFVLYAGTVSERKGAYILAEAAKSFLQEFPELTLVYAGNLHKGADVRIREIVGKNLESRIQFLGRIEFEQVYACMKKAKVFAFPSKLETWGLVVTEAMLYETPVVYTTEGPGPEVIDDGVNGLLADPNSADDVAEKIMLILNDDELANRLVKNAKIAVKERFSLDRCINETIEFYEKSITSYLE